MRPSIAPGRPSSAARRRRAALATAAAVLGLAACADDEAPKPTDAQDPDGCACDAPGPDASDFCLSCTAEQVCVQVFNGTCGQISLACEPRNAACVGNACTPGCMQWQCNDGDDPPFFRCDVGGCPGEVPGALHCYGP